MASLALEARVDSGARWDRLGLLTLLTPRPGSACLPRHAGGIGILIATQQCRLTQNSRALDLETGEWALFDSDRAADIRGGCHIAYLPRDVFSEHGLSLHAIIFRRFDRAASINRVVFSLFSTIFEEAQAIGPDDALDLAHAGIHVLKKALADAARPRAAKAVFLERIRDHVEWSIRDPRLSAERVAKALNCTPRNVHRAFECEAETLGQYILRRRLDRCRDDLAAESNLSRSVTEIAFSWGFNNASHFSRVFRRQFGCAPRACRSEPFTPSAKLDVDAKPRRAEQYGRLRENVS